MRVPVDTLVGGISELATLARGPLPRTGPALRDLGTVSDAAMGLRAGRIAWIGPERAARTAVSLRPGARRVDLGGRAVLPGFVDAHTHLLFAGDRHDEVARKLSGESYAEIARSGGGLYATVRATRSASAAELRRSALDRLGRMLRWGTTTAEVKSGYALTVEGEERLLAMVPGLSRSSGVDLVPTFLGAHAVPPEFRGRSGEYIDRLIRRALPRIARRKLARFCDVFCEPGFFSVAESERLLRAARELGLGLKIHADEFVPSGGTELAAHLKVRERAGAARARARRRGRAGRARDGPLAQLLGRGDADRARARRVPRRAAPGGGDQRGDGQRRLGDRGGGGRRMPRGRPERGLLGLPGRALRRDPVPGGGASGGRLPSRKSGFLDVKSNPEFK
jgi:hypothetical protein